MTKIKVALKGYNALTDTNPDHFSLYASDFTDYVLIKEKTFGKISVGAGSYAEIDHGLGYVPFCLVFVESETGRWRKIFSRPIDMSGYYFEITNTKLKIYNSSSSTKNYSYHIFFDEIA